MDETSLANGTKEKGFALRYQVQQYSWMYLPLHVNAPALPEVLLTTSIIDPRALGPLPAVRTIRSYQHSP